MDQTMQDLFAAIAQLPETAHADEAKPDAGHPGCVAMRRPGCPQLLGDILPLVLARLGVHVVQSPTSGEQDPT